MGFISLAVAAGCAHTVFGALCACKHVNSSTADMLCCRITYPHDLRKGVLPPDAFSDRVFAKQIYQLQSHSVPSSLPWTVL